MRFRALSLLALVALVGPVVAEAAAPPLVPITGYLTDDAGAPIDGTTTLHLKLYAGATGATTLWNEVQDVDVVDGQFTVYLGDQTTLGLSLFRDNPTVFLGMAVESGAEMSPRFEVATAPFAAYAQYCDDAAMLDGIDASDYRLVTDPVQWSDLQAVPAGLADGDADTTYTAGTGLTLTGTAFAVDQSTVDGWARAVAYDSVNELRTDLDGIYAAKMTCTPNQVLMADSSGVWLCTDSTALPLSESVIDTFVANNGYAMDAALAALTSRVDTAEGDIGALQTGLGTTNTNLAAEASARAAADGTLTTNLAATNSSLSSTQTTVTSLGSRLTTAEGTLGTLGSRVTTAESTLGTLGSRTTTAEGALSTLGTRMTSAEARIAALEAAAARPRVVGAWYPSAHQTGCSAGTYCPLKLDATRIDSSPGAFTRSADGYTITINQAGNYQLDAHALVYQNTASMVNHFEVYKNGTRIQLAHWEYIAIAGWRRYDIHRVEAFSAGDKVTVATYLSEAQYPAHLTHQGPDYTGLSLSKL